MLCSPEANTLIRVYIKSGHLMLSRASLIQSTFSQMICRISTLTWKVRVMLYTTFTCRIILYHGETWPAYQKAVNKIKSFEMKIPRQILKLTHAKGMWRIRYNEEITNCMPMLHFNLFTPEETSGLAT